MDDACAKTQIVPSVLESARARRLVQKSGFQFAKADIGYRYVQ